MNKDFKIEELLENLPDYIEGKLDEIDIKTAIESEIKNNAGFKEEFELLSSTVKAVNNFTFTEPPESYFTNFLPMFNEKSQERKQNIFIRLSIIWKLAIPVTAVLLFFFSYKTFFKSNEMHDTTNIAIQNSYADIGESKSNIIESESPDENDDIFSYENVTEFANSDVNTKSLDPKYKISKNNESPASETGQEYLNDINSEESLFFSEEDEQNYEQMFDKMDKDQQNEVILKIKESKL